MSVQHDVQHKKLSKKEMAWCAVILIALSFIIYGNGVRGGFVFDDTVVIQNRAELHHLSQVLHLFVEPYHFGLKQSGLYRPLTIASYALNTIVFGDKPTSFHVVNIILAGLNAFLVFLLIHYLLGSRTVAWLSALLFLVVPIHTEAVTSIVGRAELLAFFCSLLAFLAYGHRRYWLASSLFLLGLFSKETAIATVPFILFYEYRHGTSWQNSIKKMRFFVIPFFTYFLLRFIALGSFAIKGVTQFVENPLRFIPFTQRIGTALIIFWKYIALFFVPLHLSADYSYNSIPLVGFSWFGVLGLGILAWCVGCIVYRRTPSYLAYGSAFFFFPYILISNIPLTIGTIMAERLFYFPSLGLCIVVGGVGVGLLRHWRRSRFVIYPLVAIILIVFCGITIIRNRVWLNNTTLFNSIITVNPTSVLGHSSLAAIDIKDKKWDEAREHVRIAQSIYPNYAHTLNLSGVIAGHDGNIPLAEDYFKKSITASMYHVDAYQNLAQLYFDQKKYAESADLLERLLVVAPNVDTARDYAFLRIKTGRPKDAIDVITQFFGKRPSAPLLNFALGIAYAGIGDADNARAALLLAKQQGYTDPQVDRLLLEIDKVK